jgi:cobalt-zinc-cadmium efflux system protein
MHEHSLDTQISGRFRLAILLTALTLAAEVVGGVWTHSLALLSDAAHVFLDLFALLLSLGAIRLAAQPASDTRSFGWHRAEVFASFINGVTVFVMALGIFWEAWQRFAVPEPVKTLPMFIIASVGLVANLAAAGALHHHSHDDLNVRSAFLHVIGDAAASVGVIVGGVVMHLTGWFVLDAIISAGIAGVIFWGSWRVIREAVHIFLEGVPRGLSVGEVATAIKEVAGVGDVHHLHVWTICSHILALSGHLDILPDHKGAQARVLRAVEEMLAERFHITHTTLQVECTRCSEAPVLKNLHHQPRHGRGYHVHGSCHHGHPHDHED